MMVDEPDDTAAPLSWRVVGGGEPTAEQVAALAVALLPGPGSDDVDQGPSAWTRAALAEGVGGRPAYAAIDVPRIRYLRPHPG